MTATNGHPVHQPHAEPRFLVTVGHDGTVAIAGCPMCRDAGRLVVDLRRIAAAVEARSTPGGAG